MKRVLVIGVLCAVVIGAATVYAVAEHIKTAEIKKTASSSKVESNTSTNNTQPEQDAFNKAQYSLEDPASLWVIVNKKRPTNPASHIPGDLVLPNVTQRLPGQEAMKMRAPAATALEQMFTGARAQGIDLEITTAYRGYSFQKSLYDSYVAKDGQTAADTYSARPGYSEHQTGLAVDIRTAGSSDCYLEECFSETRAGKWLQANSQEFGFILRYPKDQTAITGYQYEPWHFRYVGMDLADELKKQGNPTLETFFNLGAAPAY